MELVIQPAAECPAAAPAAGRLARRSAAGLPGHRAAAAVAVAAPVAAAADATPPPTVVAAAGLNALTKCMMMPVPQAASLLEAAAH